MQGPSNDATARGVRPSGDAAHVLIVDDEMPVREALARVLSGQGYRVQAAGDAETALAIVRTAPFEAIVSDINMPGMSGVDFAKELRALKIDAPVVILTGAPELETAIAAIEQGIVRYLRKPVEPQALARTIRDVIRLHGLARAERLALDNDCLRSLVDELSRARDDARAASRAKTAFLAMMSHELRTPMTAIVGYTDLVLDSDLIAEHAEALNLVRSSALSLLGVLQHMLDFADLAGGQAPLTAAPFELRTCLADVVRKFEPIARAKELALRCEVDPGAPHTLIGDGQKLAQILDHLLSNALKFTPRGSVTVRLEVERASGRFVSVSASVSDTGIGIPRDAQARLVEAFAQADESSARPFGGAGLGLAISFALAHLMGGALELASAPCEGTTVRFTVPLEIP